MIDGKRLSLSPWSCMTHGDELLLDASINKQRSFAPHLWVIEVEDRAGRHLLDQDGLA